jgi:hypothetical protein
MERDDAIDTPDWCAYADGWSVGLNFGDPSATLRNLPPRIAVVRFAPKGGAESMKRLALGMSIATVGFVFGVGATAYAQSIGREPVPAQIDAQILVQSDATMYVMHDGAKFQMPTVALTDAEILAIPDATSAQWEMHFATQTTGDLTLPTPRGPGEPY